MKTRKRMAGQARCNSGQPPKAHVRPTIAGRTVAVSTHWKLSS